MPPKSKGETNPTKRELAILRVLWNLGEATVRQVYEELRSELPIVQNTVQAFLRTMEHKGLVSHSNQWRAFIYRPVLPKDKTGRKLLAGLLDQVFDGAMDQMVQSALSLRRPTSQELQRLRALVDDAEKSRTKRKTR